MSTDQKRALYGFLIFATVTGIAAAVVVANGPAGYFENDAARTAILALVVAGGVAWLGMMFLTRPRGDPREVVRDERDQIIADRAHKAAAAVTNVYLLAFCVVMVEIHGPTGSAPVVFFFFMAMSAIILSQLVLGAAMLIGYLRS